MHYGHIIRLVGLTLVLLTISCSRIGRDWDRLDKFQNDQLTLLNKDLGLKSRISISQAVIDSIQLFLQDCRDDSYCRKAREILYVWDKRKAVMEKDLLFQGELHLVDSAGTTGSTGTR